ncbi:MAG TPA: sulfite exporter TauE/SafE family protein [Candidatus Omnitrophota bacterium]|nr:sulfite exporter TauE/SafE family protein [Candidatus Omnitrophota bacterium]HPD84492.1 sulfite exporter TauE/SafE family protein [Candidatus Omnitrophota bacterium]HRZ03350.1 sulfite exporter TauE/SafE family protein [Candidatus Omnitrophota bacterium]
MGPILWILIGLAGGVVSGAFGVGGGIVMIPMLVYFLHFTQHMAQGTCLAIILLPVGIFAVLQYYYKGNVHIPVAAFAVIGFVFGAFLGAYLIHSVPDENLKRAFGILLIIVGIKMAFFK